MVSTKLTALLVLLQMGTAERAPHSSLRSAEMTLIVEPERVVLCPNETTSIDLSQDFRKILIGDQEIVKVVIRSTRQVYLVGVTIGKTDVTFYDSEDNQIGAFNVWVSEDLGSQRPTAKHERPETPQDPVFQHFLNELWMGDWSDRAYEAPAKWKPRLICFPERVI